VIRSSHVRRLQSRLERTVGRYGEATEGRALTVAELRALRLPWFDVRDAAAAPALPEPAEADVAESGDVAEVLLFDEIGGSFGVDASALVEDIARIEAGTIRVRINSPGGSVFDALAIMNALNHHDARVQVFVDALAASAATIVAMAGDEIVMMPGSQMMIHDASATEDGNAQDMLKLATFLDRQSQNIADLYAARAGGEPGHWRALMLEETWLFADEAVTSGLADRVEPTPSKGSSEVESRALDLSAYGFRYAGREQAPAPRLEGERRVRSVLRGEYRSAATATREQSGRRFSGLTRVETRTEDDGSIRVTGHAALFDSPTWIGPDDTGFEEVIAAGAFTKTLRDGADVRFLFNHNPDLVLARTKSGTLQLRDDGRGLAVEAHLAPTTTGRDLAMLLDRGDVDEMSFGFIGIRSEWSRVQRDGRTVDRRTIAEARLLDVSGVTYPAYNDTDLARREAQLARELRSARIPQQQSSTPRPERTSTTDLAPPTGTPGELAGSNEVDERSMSGVDMLLRHAAGDHVGVPRARCTACAAPAPAEATPDA
jgi:HK97 family phage prohead protease